MFTSKITCSKPQISSIQPSQCLVQKMLAVKPWVFKPKKIIYSLQEPASQRKRYSTSHWTQQQNKKYVDFLLNFRDVIEGEKKLRRKWHLNRIMSKHVGTRSHEQCRSHHQKMLKSYQNISGIIQHLQREENSTEPSHEEIQTEPTLKNDIKGENQATEEILFEVMNWRAQSLGFSEQLEADFNLDSR